MTDSQNDTDTIAATEIEEMDARMRLAALKLLKARKEKIGERHQARKDYWRNTLTDLTQSLNEAIDAPIPIKDAQCRKSLAQIKQRRSASVDAKEEKAAELKGLKTAIAAIEATMDDLMVKDVANQMALDLGTDQSAWLTKDVAEQVNLALSAKETKDADNGEEMAPDLVALRQQLASMGFEALVVKDDEEIEAEGDSDNESGPEGDETEDKEIEDEEGDGESDDGEVEYEEDPSSVDGDNVISLAGNG